MKSSWRNFARSLRTLEARGVLFAMLLGTPLLYIPNDDTLSIQLQSLGLVSIASVVLLYSPYRKVVLRSISTYGRVTKALFLVFISFAFISSLTSKTLSVPLALFGTYPEYIGLLQWISFFIIALFLKDRIFSIIASRLTMTVVSLVIVISMVIDRVGLFGDFQLHGLLFQATNMGVYSCLGVISCLSHLEDKLLKHKIFTLVNLTISTFGVLFSQSRIAMFAFAVICAISLFKSVQKVKAIVLSIMTIVVTIFIIAAPSFATRYQQEDVGGGLSYRLHIYSIGLKELAERHVFIGNGAGAHPNYLNEQKQVPEDIAKDLRVGLRFASAHDVFIDVGLMFGLIPLCIAIVAAIKSAIHYSTLLFATNDLRLFLIFITVSLNSLVNVPSITLTMLLVLFVILGVRNTHEELR